MPGKRILVVGAGAAGMMAAGTAAQNGAQVVVLERNARTGRKLMITGKGRCNVTNDCDVRDFIAAVPANGNFLFSAASRFSPHDTMAFFESRGLALKTERGRRVFPQSDKASDVVETMTRFLRQTGCNIVHGRAQALLLENGRVQGVRTEDGKVLSGDCVIIACGGLSYPRTGSTGDGYRLARAAGHTITPLGPSLVPLMSSDAFCPELQGLTLKNIAIKVIDQEQKKERYKDFGELLFTHFGLSGPVILSASAHMRPMRKGRYMVYIDLKPALSEEQLQKRLLRDFQENKNKAFLNALHGLLPKAMIPVVVARSGILPQTKCNGVTRQQRMGFSSLLKNFAVQIEGFRPVEEAIITAGGVHVKEIDPKTMQSRLVKGLYFAGEVIDVDAYTGGYNLQIAFSTGYLAGVSAAVLP